MGYIEFFTVFLKGDNVNIVTYHCHIPTHVYWTINKSTKHNCVYSILNGWIQSLLGFTVNTVSQTNNNRANKHQKLHLLQISVRDHKSRFWKCHAHCSSACRIMTTNSAKYYAHRHHTHYWWPLTCSWGRLDRKLWKGSLEIIGKKERIRCENDENKNNIGDRGSLTNKPLFTLYEIYDLLNLKNKMPIINGFQ